MPPSASLQHAPEARMGWTGRRITRSMAAAANPMAVVLGTVELLERIISFLPEKDIFRVQRVSKKWRDLIVRSRPIRERAFVKTQERHEFWRLVYREWRANSSPEHAEKCPGLSSQPIEPSDATIEPVHVVTPLVMNPVLQRWARSEFTRSTKTGTQLSPSYFHGWSLASYDNFVENRQMSSQRLSVWSAYISDPPCFEAEVSIDLCLVKRKQVVASTNQAWFHTYDLHSRAMLSGITATSATGLTLGDVVHAAFTLRGTQVEFNSFSDDLEIQKIDEIQQKVHALGGATVQELRSISEDFGWVCHPTCPKATLTILVPSGGLLSNVPCVVPLKKEWKAARDGKEMVIWRLPVHHNF